MCMWALTSQHIGKNWCRVRREGGFSVESSGAWESLALDFQPLLILFFGSFFYFTIHSVSLLAIEMRHLF